MSEHAKSYYAASLNWQTDYPELQGEQRCDVAVVGAGFTGVSTALHLAEWGYLYFRIKEVFGVTT